MKQQCEYYTQAFLKGERINFSRNVLVPSANKYLGKQLDEFHLSCVITSEKEIELLIEFFQALKPCFQNSTINAKLPKE